MYFDGIFHECVSYNSKRKRRTFPYTTLTYWFCRCKNSVFSVRTESSLLMKNRVFWDMRQSRLVNSLKCFGRLLPSPSGHWQTLPWRWKHDFSLAQPVACTNYPIRDSSKQRRVSETREFGKEQEKKDLQPSPLQNRALSTDRFLVFVLLRGRSQLVADAWSGRVVRSVIAGRRMPSRNARRSETTNIDRHCPLLRTWAWRTSRHEWLRLRL